MMLIAVTLNLYQRLFFIPLVAVKVSTSALLVPFVD
jgi:hypothetical protein